jgi:hypothetical protein
MRSVGLLDQARQLAVTPAFCVSVLAGFGLVLWIGLSVWAGFAGQETAFRLREAWDAPAYFYVGLPLMVVTVAVAGFMRPERAWRWPVSLVAGHQVGLLLVGLGMQSELSLLILTLLLAAMLAAILFIPALLGSTAARMLGGSAI